MNTSSISASHRALLGLVLLLLSASLAVTLGTAMSVRSAGGSVVSGFETSRSVNHPPVGPPSSYDALRESAAASGR